jgi:hypothetical protein
MAAVMAIVVAAATAMATSMAVAAAVRRDPKILRRVSWILNKEGLHFANLFYIFE